MKAPKFIEFKSFVHLNQEEIKFVLDLRNSEEVRKNCLDQHIITYEEQIEFIKQLKYDLKRFYMLVSFDGEYQGYYSFKISDTNPHQANFGLCFKPQSRANAIAFSFFGYRLSLMGIRELKDTVLKSNELQVNHCALNNIPMVEDPNNDQIYNVSFNIEYIKLYIQYIVNIPRLKNTKAVFIL